MKRQGMKKLVLDRETVRLLDDRLRGVVAGNTITCGDSCDSLPGSHCFDCSMQFPGC